MIVTVPLPAPSLPAAAPPSLRKSLSLMAESLPAPATIRRDALRPSGARISRVEPLFPLNWFVSAARLTRLAARPSVFRVAPPNFRASSQNTTRVPRGTVENGTKPTLTASDIGNSSKIRADAGREAAGAPEMFPSNVIHGRQEHGPRQYGLRAAALPSASSGRGAT